MMMFCFFILGLQSVLDKLTIFFNFLKPFLMEHLQGSFFHPVGGHFLNTAGITNGAQT